VLVDDVAVLVEDEELDVDELVELEVELDVDELVDDDVLELVELLVLLDVLELVELLVLVDVLVLVVVVTTSVPSSFSARNGSLTVASWRAPSAALSTAPD
jgi:hypothetical protein